MPTTTYTPLANTTLASTATSLTFSSISQAYRDLVLVVNGTASTDGNIAMRFNSDTGNNYDQVVNYASSYTPYSWNPGGAQGLFYATLGGSTSNRTSMIINVMDYSATDKHKVALWRNTHLDGVEHHTGRWASTSAITSVTLSISSWSVGTTFTLYGIAA